LLAPGISAGGQGLSDGGGRLHWRPAPVGGVRRGIAELHRRPGLRAHGRPPGHRPRVVTAPRQSAPPPVTTPSPRASAAPTPRPRPGPPAAPTGPPVGRRAARPEVRLPAHFSGTLLEWLRDQAPATFDRLATVVARGQVELLPGGFYEPILAVLPDADKRGQI